jgi:type IX secretion system PorP/SprF family membrane protein
MLVQKMKYKIYTILLVSFAALSFCKAQQDPNYTQYMYNMSVINPAYALSDTDLIQAGLLYRSQWVGSVGGPTTGTLFGHMSFTDRMQGGVSVVHDEIGDVVSETNFYLDYAYVLPIGKTTAISFGLKAGFTSFSTNFNGFVYSDPLPDPSFAENLSSLFPNIGLGTYLFGDNYYVGLSAPNILQSEHLKDESGVFSSAREELHLYLTAGYVLDLNENLKFKPAFLANSVINAPISLDVTANFLFNEKLEIGVAYGFENEAQALVNFKVAPFLRIGYAYDYLFSNLGRFNNGSHEVMILMDLSKTSNGYDKSPRFF